MSHHSQASIAARRHSRLRQHDPNDLHDYLPSRQPENDLCSVCGRVYDAAVHIPIGPEDPGDV